VYPVPSVQTTGGHSEWAGAVAGITERAVGTSFKFFSTPINAGQAAASVVVTVRRPSGSITLRTREMRRSALVKVPSFSRKDEPGRNTWAYLAVSLRKMSCTTTHSIAVSASITCWVLGSDWTMSSPWQYRPLKLPSSAASNMLGMRRPGSGFSVTPQACSNRLRVVVSEMWR